MGKRNNIHSQYYKSERSTQHEDIITELFTKILERDFFAECTLHIANSDKKNIDFVADLRCNFNLTEGLFQLNNGNWNGVIEKTIAVYPPSINQ